LIFYTIEIVYSIAFLIWFIHPEMIFPDNSLMIRDLESIIASKPGAFPLPWMLSILVWGAGALSLLKLSAPFFRKLIPMFSDVERIIPGILSVIQSFIVLFLISLYMITFGSNADFFFTIDMFTYGAFGISLLHNFIFISHSIGIVSRKNSSYIRYLEMRESEKPKSPVSFIMKKGIRMRLVLSFEALILSVIAVLSILLLSEFRKSILNSIKNSGTTLAEQFSDIVKANPSISIIEMDDFLQITKRKNDQSDLPFTAITVFFKMGKQNAYISRNSTSRENLNIPLKNEYASITTTTSIHDAQMGSYDFIAPARLGKLIIEYTVVSYDDTVIYASFFQTMVKVIFISVFFIYVASFFVFILASRIVFPILLLKLSVQKMTQRLSEMIKGKSRIKQDELDYTDGITTKDEIKDLSSEFKNMASVIKGIVPYVSASTLKHADHETQSTMRKELAFLFTDIRGFTTLCEGLDPAQVVSILNKYLDIQSTIILDHNGDIDKFVGDEIMATFEGDDMEMNACLASMEIREAMAREKSLQKKSDEMISIGIGIHSGPVVFGSVGAKERMDYTSIGDTVNLAARLESANKTYGTKALITDSIYARLDNQFVAREIDYITVKGKTVPVRIFEILQKTEKISKRVEDIKELYESGLACYRERKWKEATAFFTKNVRLYNDEPSRVFLHRIETFKTIPPPKNWDGVFNLTVK
jgi:adenylate cyclase